jgi:type II secretory pathway component PulF
VTIDLGTRARLCAELATLEAAGFSAARAFDTCGTWAEGNARVAIETVARALAKGHGIAQAGVRAGLFSPLDATLIEAGAAAGKLEQLYRRLAARYQDRADHQRRMWAQLILPLALLVFGAFIARLPALIHGESTVGR